MTNLTNIQRDSLWAGPGVQVPLNWGTATSTDAGPTMTSSNVVNFDVGHENANYLQNPAIGAGDQLCMGVLMHRENKDNQPYRVKAYANILNVDNLTTQYAIAIGYPLGATSGCDPIAAPAAIQAMVFFLYHFECELGAFVYCEFFMSSGACAWVTLH